MSIGKNLKCSAETSDELLTRDIVVEKGHVRRARRAMEMVVRQATRAHGRDNGVVLMTAVMLVECLAKSLDRDPLRVLDTMARCFDFKRRHLEAQKQAN
jgi:hypothetical protein